MGSAATLPNAPPPSRTISSGRNDGIARPDAEREMQGSLIHLGFRNVRLSSFYGGHELDCSDLREALR